MKIRNVLSLFDGKSSGYTALELAEIEFGDYYSSEIDKYAIQVSDAIHPNQVRLGDITKWNEWNIDWSSIDLIMAGSPCQGFSFAGKQLAFDDQRSKLFFEFVDILNHVKSLNPRVKFLLENVKMKKEYMAVIDEQLGVDSMLINSALVSAQNRQRLYWSNIPIDEPLDRGVKVNSILEGECCKINSAGWHKWWGINKDFQIKKKYSAIVNNGATSKLICMTTRQYASWNGNFVRVSDGVYRNLTPRECFRGQTTPEHYIDKILSCGVSNSQLHKIAGNGWTDEVIAHILRGMAD